MAILVLGGVLIFMSLIQTLKAPDRSLPGEQGKEAGTYAETGEVRYGNPTMSWYEKWFCRGFKRSSFCNYRLLHPLKETLEDQGVEITEGPPKQREAILYKGELPKRNGLSSKVVLDDELKGPDFN